MGCKIRNLLKTIPSSDYSWIFFAKVVRMTSPTAGEATLMYITEIFVFILSIPSTTQSKFLYKRWFLYTFLQTELYCILNPLRKKNYIKNDVGPIEKSPSWNLLSLANWSDERYEMFRCEIDYFRYAVCILQCCINDVQLRDWRRNEERGKGRDSMSKVTSR